MRYPFLRWALNILLTISLCGLLLSILYLTQGSLEASPSAEQQEKAKITALLLIAIFTAAGAVFFRIKTALKKKE